MSSPEKSVRTRRVSRPWRIAFVLYALALTIGTHWPRLQLPEVTPASDKLIHVYAFSGFAILLWQTRWLKSRWLLGVIGFAWAALDESTQGLPGLNRHVSTYDLLANMMGVLVAVAGLWAFRPAGVKNGPSQRRSQDVKLVFDEVFAEARPWLALMITFICAAILVLIIQASMRLYPGDTKWLITICAILAWFTVCIQWGNMGKRKARELEVNFRASAPTLKIALRPMLLAAVCLMIGFSLILTSPIVYAWALNKSAAGFAMGAARAIGTLPYEFAAAVDLTILAIVVLIATRAYRVGMAKFYDRSAICLKCGHDLRGTPVDQNGQGRCGECGAEFNRASVIQG